MSGPASFNCDCGKIAGQISRIPEKGIHLVCHCPSCRAGALYCGEALPEGKPVDLYLTQPANVKITKGSEHLNPFVFSPGGILRWQADCCGVQMFSSQPNPKIAFMSVRVDRLEDSTAAGPILCRSFVPQPGGKSRHIGKGALARLIGQSLVARLNGSWRKTPLYDVKKMKPVVTPTLVSKEAKRALLA